MSCIYIPPNQKPLSLDIFFNLKGNLDAGERRGSFGAVILGIEARCGLDVLSMIGEDIK